MLMPSGPVELLFLLFRLAADISDVVSMNRSNFDKGLHNLLMFIQRRHKNHKNNITIYIVIRPFNQRPLMSYIKRKYHNNGRQLYEQKLILKFNTYNCGLNLVWGFLSKYAFFNKS